MNKAVAVTLFVLIAVSPVAGEVQYSIRSDGNAVWKNTTVGLDCSTTCPGLTWTLNPGEEVISVRDSRGEIDYTVDGNSLSIPGRRFTGQERRVVEIRTVNSEDAEEIHAGLYKRTLQLSGFSGERTSGTIRVEDLQSGWTGFGFEESFSGDEMRFRGSGPVNIRVKFGNGYETRYFTFFGGQPSGTGVAYEVPVGTTGLVQQFERFPVAVMDDATYDRKVNEWSAGEYVSGAIQIRSPESSKGDFLPVLAHEVVHGLNDRVLNWDQTRSTYFDEGTGKYVEFLVKKKMEGQDRTRNVFGEDVTYRERRDGQLYRITLPSKGDPDELWNYYQQDGEFMKTWNAMSEEPDRRRFGYAYSELVVRNYVSRMNGSLRDLYSRLQVERRITDPEVKWQLYSRHMDMTPCEYDTRERFEQCLDTINSYDYPVYSAEPTHDSQPLQIERLEVPNRTTTGQRDLMPGGEVNFVQFLQGFADYIVKTVNSLLQALAASA
ncbi:MAG: hypothetical protein ABEJ07_05950 [Candidatus Nanohaloarchaea archaeon]